MIDIKDLRKRPEIYKKNIEKRGKDPTIINSILILDEKWRKLKKEADELRAERNKISDKINQVKKSGHEEKVKELIKHAKEILEKLKKTEEAEIQTNCELLLLLKKIPNLMHKSVPFGKTEKDNKVRKVFGKKINLKFKPKNHVELIESLNFCDFDASAKVSGSGFYYLKDDLALLNRALINFTIDFMKKRGYIYIEPPLMINKKIAEAAGDLEAFKNALYKIENENLYLIPTAEHAILGMLSEKTIPEEKLPLKFFGYSMCFRKEVGSHGINEKGLWRTHQFNKVEQFIFCHPKDSWKYYKELKENTEIIMKKLGLAYRIVEICSGDLGDWKAKSEDIEVWRPTLKSYGEVASLSNCTDFQARPLNIRGISKKGERYVLHTLNNTALATSRIMVAILENYQQKDGSIKIPKVLVPYMNGRKVIGKIENLSKKKSKKKK
ncbi:MAG: serine--tRNA ligase [Candidatus Pacearchaeota archaeon]